jgi:16S rRNA (cytosine1402-N4)-methyltransferase
VEASYHAPVMVREVLSYLKPERGGVYFDGTLGGGGHSEAILGASNGVRLIAVDQDTEAHDVAGRRLERFGDRVHLVHASFAVAAEALASPLAGALLDLGVSSHQIDEAGRGFSFRAGTILDMRMHAADDRPTAAALLNELAERELADVFFNYGEERRSRAVARAIVSRRREAPFVTSDDLNAVLDAVLGWGRSLEPADRARLYQALRIAVNDELRELERALPALRDALEPAGVLAVLSYHSLEDRLVKDAFREWSRSCICPPELPICVCRGAPLGKALTRKPVMAGEAEISANPRARSARLRAWRKAA